jgi:hypothetical protein
MFGHQHGALNLRAGSRFESMRPELADGLFEIKLVAFFLHASLPAGRDIPLPLIASVPSNLAHPSRAAQFGTRTGAQREQKITRGKRILPAARFLS